MVTHLYKLVTSQHATKSSGGAPAGADPTGEECYRVAAARVLVFAFVPGSVSYGAGEKDCLHGHGTDQRGYHANAWKRRWVAPNAPPLVHASYTPLRVQAEDGVNKRRREHMLPCRGVLRRRHGEGGE